MKFSKINLKLVRSFAIGFVVHSPSLNGLYVEIHFGCLTLALWSRGEKLIRFDNFWRG